VVFLKRKIATTLIVLGIALALGIGSVSAEEIELYVYTNKASYEYGEHGTLYATVWNKGGAVDLENIEVNFPWEGLYHETWDGNATLDISSSIGKGEQETYEIAFTIPSESRGTWGGTGAAQVTLNYEESSVWIVIAVPVSNENIMPTYYLTIVLAIAVIVVIIELYFVWRRLGRPSLTATTA
jgi:uncharacterized membrane protein